MEAAGIEPANESHHTGLRISRKAPATPTNARGRDTRRVKILMQAPPTPPDADTLAAIEARLDELTGLVREVIERQHFGLARPVSSTWLGRRGRTRRTTGTRS